MLARWTGPHDYSFALGGVYHDSNLSTVHTPGLAQRQGSTDRVAHSDWLGSTRYLSDSTGNSFPSALRYDAFGQRTATAGPAHPTNFLYAGSWGYQTEYADAADPGLGVQYLEQRYSDPAIGRFISPDPLRFAAGLNLFAYVDADPVSGVDPSGLDPLDWIHGGLDALGFLPAAGIIPDAISGLLYLAEGKKADAAFSAVAAIPAVGDAAKGAALGIKECRALRTASEATRAVRRTTRRIGSARRLARNLRAAATKRPLRTAAHHIVASDSPKALEAQAVLRRFAIEIDEAVNGVFLPIKGSLAPGAYHPSLHTDRYFEEVNIVLSQATTKEHVLEILEDIRRQLLGNIFPH